MRMRTLSPVTVEQVDYRYAVRFRYDPELIAIIKDSVHWRNREYDSATKTWLVDSMCIES